MGSNYHPQQRCYFIKGSPDSIGQQQQAPQQQQQQQQHRHSTTQATTMTVTAPANGLPRAPPASATKTAFDQYSIGRLHQHQYANINNNHRHQRGSPPPLPPTARHLRHLYEPSESMAALGVGADSADQSGAAPRGRVSDQVHHLHYHHQRHHQQQQQRHTNTSSDSSPKHSHSHHGLRKHEQSGAQLEQRRNMTSECCHSASSETGRSNQADFDQLEPEADQYANQLRRSQLLQQQQRSRPEAPASFHTGPNKQTQAGQLQAEHKRPSVGGSKSGAGQQQHVNFNRSSQAQGGKDTDDDETGESGRKKKYLTAKYGQQQMNLIKKRLKIEMWLHDQLQELAKASKVIEQEELDDIDIDLDLLLDMEDDLTRRRSLKKTLEPLSDLPGESLEKFIDEVLEQSKLL